MVFDPKTLTWKCHVCGDERPDAKISVFSKPLMINGQVCGQTNVRYCNDRQACIEGAPNVDFMKGANNDR